MAQSTGNLTQNIARELPELWYRETPLERSVARYLWWGLAISTRNLYETGRKSYVAHCRIATTNPPFPATTETLTSWMVGLATRGIRVKTIKSYLGGVKSCQIDMGIGDLEVFQLPLLQRILTGIKRLHGEGESKERLPITRDILLKLLANLNPAKDIHANLHAAFCLAFAGFLRAGEFTYSPQDQKNPAFSEWHITRRSISLQTDKLYLSLPLSKTDPFRRGITLTIAASNDPACAVSSLQNLFRRFPKSPNSPLFQLPEAVAFSRQYLAAALKTYLQMAHIPGKFSGHLFRRGAATTARQAGLTEDEIQLLGRWKSDSWKLYVQINESHHLQISRRFQE